MSRHCERLAKRMADPVFAHAYEEARWDLAFPMPREVLRWTWLGPRFGQRCGACCVTFPTAQAYLDHYRIDHALPRVDPSTTT